MISQLIEGKVVAASVREDIRRGAAELLAASGRAPGLAVILVGEDPASLTYVTSKGKACDEAGFHSVTRRFPSDVTQAELLAAVAEYNADPSIDGILIQLPLPPHIDSDAVLQAVDPTKDVDGFHPANTGKLVLGQETFIPCTPLGIRHLLQHYNIETRGRFVVVMGRSRIVGLPMANLLLQRGPGADATVCVCHSRTANLQNICRQADILIAAVGHARYVTREFIKPGATVIDVGINRIADPHNPGKTRLVGDVDFEAVKEVAGAITPVPGGVGPMTIAMLLLNTLESARRRFAAQRTAAAAAKAKASAAATVAAKSAKSAQRAAKGAKIKAARSAAAAAAAKPAVSARAAAAKKTPAKQSASARKPAPRKR